MPIRHLLPIALAAATLLALAGAAEAADYVPGEVVVKYKDSASSQVHRTSDVRDAVTRLRHDPRVDYAVPNYVAHAAQFIPNDPGFRLQWNLSGAFGIGMPEAWTRAAGVGAPGGRGAVVAVLDSGAAYENRGRFRRAPDFKRTTFVRGYDFVGHDRHPDDAYGHGTHVAGTIAEATNNARAAAGIAYGAKIMPLKVLNDFGEGDSVAIAKAIRYAARHHADVINLSLEFDPTVVAAEIPDILSAIRYARKRGVVIVAAAGNKTMRRVAYPARASGVIAVGATTRDGCQADYSDSGADLDVVAPGGGVDNPDAGDPNCNPDDVSSDWIYQETFRGHGVTHFGLPSGYEGTSMASPHVAAIAALLIATKKLGAHPSPKAIQDQIQATARDLGPPGFDERYGWGLVDAARALRCPPFMAC
jgi:serine protease